MYLDKEINKVDICSMYIQKGHLSILSILSLLWSGGLVIALFAVQNGLAVTAP